MFYEKMRPKKFRKIHRKTPVPEYLALVFCSEFYESFRNNLFTEHLQATASLTYFLWKFTNIYKLVIQAFVISW